MTLIWSFYGWKLSEKWTPNFVAICNGYSSPSATCGQLLFGQKTLYVANGHFSRLAKDIRRCYTPVLWNETICSCYSRGWKVTSSQSLSASVSYTNTEFLCTLNFDNLYFCLISTPNMALNDILRWGAKQHYRHLSDHLQKCQYVQTRIATTALYRYKYQKL